MRLNFNAKLNAKQNSYKTEHRIQRKTIRKCHNKTQNLFQDSLKAQSIFATDSILRNKKIGCLIKKWHSYGYFQNAL